MRRLDPQELEASPLLPLAHPSEARTHAVRIVASLHGFLREELGLSAEKVELLEVELEHALILHARVTP